MPKTNNFGLIRLAAALQVVLEHSVEHLQIDLWDWAIAVISLFPGAPRYSQELSYKLAEVSFAPWFYMFVVGILFQRNFAVMDRWLAGRFLPSIVSIARLRPQADS